MGADPKPDDTGREERLQGTKTEARDARAERLAAQLKANLRRRKDQARARAEPERDGSG